MDHSSPGNERDWTDFLRGLATLAGLWLLVYAMAFFHLLIPESILRKLSESTYSFYALIAFGGLTSSTLLLVFRLTDVTFGFPGKFIQSQRLQAYIRALPLYVLIGVAVVSGLVVFSVVPYCQAPSAVKFQVDDTDYNTGDTLLVPPGKSLTIQAKPLEKDMWLSCNWQYAGDAFDFIGQKKGCSITINFSKNPGSGVLALQASQSFCPQSTVFSLRVEVNDETP